jgi:putative transposase
MQKISYSGYRFPPEIIHQAIWLYLRFALSLRDVEDLLAQRGVAVLVNHFGPMIAADLRKRRLKPHTTWHLDEVYLKIDVLMVYLWRAVDAEGEVLDVLVQSQAKHARRAETDAQAPEEVCLCSGAVGHRRTAIIQRRGPRTWDRMPARARAMEEQQSLEFASADAAAGAQDAAVQERRLCAEIPVEPCCRLQHFQCPRHLTSAQAHRVLRAEAMNTWRTAAAAA